MTTTMNATTKTKALRTAVEDYFTDLRRVQGSGGATQERSLYGPLSNLLTAVGRTLKPKVFCVQELADQGAGHPDFGLYEAKQVQKGTPREGQMPERGIIEVKSPSDDAWLTAGGRQASRYWKRYRLVLVTNARDFVLVGEDAQGKRAILETLQLARSEEEFQSCLEKPQAFAQDVGAGLGEYLARALTHQAALTEPKDLAGLLASYARDGLARIEAAGGAPELANVRVALESALGIQFKDNNGQRFFRSTLIQTLFYGIFSAWVLWARAQMSKPEQRALFRDTRKGERFDWRVAVWHLRTPVLRALFQQIADPGRLGPLGLTEVLDWTAAALHRVDRSAFFDRFNLGKAVPYFYEPFLEAFDPALRRQLGVWYTPPEIVRYMVGRVDQSLKDELSIADGLAGKNVYVLDPCCGTGAYLAEVLRRIATNLKDQGLGAVAGARVKEAAIKRVFGFEIMPAPFVVAHLQVGLTMEELDARLANDGSERAGVYLTNALTGWEPRTDKPKLLFPELEKERDRADRVKQERPILVILGNPPYNGFADVAVDEERELSDAYRATNRVRGPEGRGLNDPYVRFFRMAERRITEKTGQGVICFISNYSWLDKPSFTGMRERYLEAFDTIHIDNLHGDRIISEYAPDGRVSETVFALRGQSSGIKVGTSIALLTRRQRGGEKTRSTAEVRYREFQEAGAEERREALEESVAANNKNELMLEPDLRLGLPLRPTPVSDKWFEWPTLPELFPASFPGVLTKRAAFLIDIDLDRLRARIADYFDPTLSNEEIQRRYPAAMRNLPGSAVQDASAVRTTLLTRGGPVESGFVRHAYRPFDHRWLYWDDGQGLLGRPVPEYKPHVFKENLWLSAAHQVRKGANEPQSYCTRDLGCLHLIERGAHLFPAWLQDNSWGTDALRTPRPNLSGTAQRYLNRLGASVEDLLHHVVATVHDPAYREANAGALRMDWPRIPLPGWNVDESNGAARALADSAARGRELAGLLDPDRAVQGVTHGTLRPDVAAIAEPSTVNGRNMSAGDFAMTAGWGHYGSGDAVMPGQGRAVERDYTKTERAELDEATTTLGATTFDIYLNDNAFWRNVPAAVWTYKLGGYQVLKKWLSYRERGVVGRALTPDEVLELTKIARRITAILMMK